MIDIQHLTKRYGRTIAVDDLCFTVKPGHVTAFLGPNGAGKSTTMRLMLGLDRPAHGDVRFDGKRYEHLHRPLHTVGAMLEARSMHGGRSGYHHLLWLAQSNRLPKARVKQVLEMVGLPDAARRRVSGYSLGMTQRLGIAAALLGDPPVLLLDEPVNGLDPEGIVWIRHLLKELAGQGRTVFVSSHFMAETALTAQHLIVIGRGRLLADTTVPGLIGESASLEEAFIRLTAGGQR
ncbi:hypothetical protein Rhe02_06640 [Rhizocola hellebori]|uniref:ABC transporter domain-containing protein n=1 Tax=Rhizocola hellebori TaxID=1392758 RepID=A0A8J3Q355_9ACTN|nr:ATP-binding cassette domain-containing protein [Rhizocola hellebori]GIH02597.1 hypothetical protein Rhe02_06640 [Rhizocola hellebori]